MSPSAAAAHDAIGRSLSDHLGDLEPIGRDARSGGWNRHAWTGADAALREWFAGMATARGMTVQTDAAQNLWAWWGSPSDGDAVVTGSHLDSVRHGGAFDGPLGVIGGFLAVDELRARGVRPGRPVAVVAFGDEEGARFGVACAGSRLLTGSLTPDDALALRDDDGVTMSEALTRSGVDPTAVRADHERVASLAAFIELHVEQGRGLVHLDAPVGLVSFIRPHGRWRLDLTGRGDHAGTTRIADRDDPMLRQAVAVLAAREAALAEGGDDAVATIGRVLVHPNGVNAVPSEVRAWLDARADDPAAVERMVAAVAAAAGVEAVAESVSPAAPLDGALRDRVAAAVAGRVGDVPVLASGAGHDAGILAAAGVPTAMLIARNPTGVSHAPEEHAEIDDCATAVLALADALDDLVAP